MKEYVLDTNVVIALSKYHKFKNVNKLMQIDNLDYYKAQSIEVLYNKIKNGEITCYVLPLTVDEINQGTKHFGPATINYLQESNISVITGLTQEQTTLINELGNFYFTHKDPSSHETAFDTHDEKFNGKNDSFIMAGCSVLGLSIITFDKHFTKKYFTIKNSNQAFKRGYVKSNHLEHLLSPNYDNVKVHKPTFIMKNKYNDFSA